MAITFSQFNPKDQFDWLYRLLNINLAVHGLSNDNIAVLLRFGLKRSRSIFL